jgi:hypothetical protein
MKKQTIRKRHLKKTGRKQKQRNSRPPKRAKTHSISMNVLLRSLGEVEAQFGKKATMASSLLDMVRQGEKAYGFLTGTMDSGWDVTVGLFNGKARYARFKKRRGTKLTEGDLRAVWMQIGPLSNWKKSDDPDYFDYTEKQGDNVVAAATGWQTPVRSRAFIYVPIVPNEVGILPDRTAVDQKP